jgi:hypothetical protein
MVQDSHMGIEITSRSTGTVSGVKRKSPEEGHRTLGFQISGDGKFTAQKKAMKEKAILFGEGIRSITMWKQNRHGVQHILYAELGIWYTSHHTDKSRF